jgi:single-strand DNA-binding protein
MSLEIHSGVVGGNLTRDVEVRSAGAGKVATFAVANNRTYMSNGTKQSEVSYVDVDVWGVIGENCAKYLKKGSPVVVVGRLKQERWQTSDGASRSKFKVVAQNVQFLSFGSEETEVKEPVYFKAAESKESVEPEMPAEVTPWEE